MIPNGFIQGNRKNLSESGIPTLSLESKAQQGAGGCTATTGYRPVGAWQQATGQWGLGRTEADSFTFQ